MYIADLSVFNRSYQHIRHKTKIESFHGKPVMVF